MPGAGAVKAVRARVERLDEFVAVARPFGEQHEQHELQVLRRELAAAADPVADAAPETFATEASLIVSILKQV